VCAVQNADKAVKCTLFWVAYNYLIVYTNYHHKACQKSIFSLFLARIVGCTVLTFKRGFKVDFRFHRYGACYYCVCTACTRFKCPFKHRLYQECQTCQDRGVNRPRLECDFFCHYLKTKHFKFKRVVAPLPEHSGTYILKTNGSVYIGTYDKLLKLSKLFGGKPCQLNIIDENFYMK
jgi:hypothetical protein